MGRRESAVIKKYGGVTVGKTKEGERAMPWHSPLTACSNGLLDQEIIQ